MPTDSSTLAAPTNVLPIAHRRLDVRVTQAAAAYAHSEAYQQQTTVGAVVDRALITERDRPDLVLWAQSLLDLSADAYEWLGSVPLPEELDGVGDNVLMLHEIAAGERHGDVGILGFVSIHVIGPLLQAYWAAKAKSTG